MTEKTNINITQEKLKINIYRCGFDLEHPMQTLGATVAEARRSFGCRECGKNFVCQGPVLLEDKSESKPAKKKTKEDKNMGRPKDEKEFGSLGEAVKAITEKSGEAMEMLLTTATSSEKISTKPPVQSHSRIDAKTDSAIRKDILQLSQAVANPQSRSIAPMIVEVFGDEIKTARSAGHGWDSISKIFRKHGLRIGKKSLRVEVLKKLGS
jgi:hypothetical protein